MIVGDAGLGVVGAGAAEVLHRHLLAGDRLDDVGAGDEHLRGLVDHEREVGERGGVDVRRPRTAPMISEICGMTPEDITLRWKISPYRPSETTTLLDPRAAALVDADDRAAGLQREVHAP